MPLNSGRLSAPRLPWVLMLVIALPVAAVIAGLTTVGISLSHADHELPASYHWEGALLDRDQSQLGAAARLGIGATLQRAANGKCELLLRGARPAALRLSLTHPTDPTQDRVVALERAGDGYAGHCGALPVTHWWISVADAGQKWLLRTRTYGDLQAVVVLEARSGGS